jgi:hypothetical protein
MGHFGPAVWFTEAIATLATGTAAAFTIGVEKAALKFEGLRNFSPRTTEQPVQSQAPATADNAWLARIVNAFDD